MSGMIVYGRHVVVSADSVIPSGAVYIEGETVVDVGSYREITTGHKAGRTIGSAEALVISGLVNAHSHGKGLTEFQVGPAGRYPGDPEVAEFSAG
jgi:cytosine/adenosine deaminase-related metal-dependent hydrolase